MFQKFLNFALWRVRC